MRRITLKSPMWIAPESPAASCVAGKVTWVNFQWKLRAHPDQHPVKINTALFGVHRATLYRRAKAGQVRVFRKYPITLLKVADVEAFIEYQTVRAQEVAQRLRGRGDCLGGQTLPPFVIALMIKHLGESFGAVEKTRTSTGVTPQRPQRCASTNSATTALS